MISFEAINAAASLGTFIVIGVTATVAVVQLRHLRASNQLTGLLNVLSRVEDPVFNQWVDQAKKTLDENIADHAYRMQILHARYPRENNAWLNMCNSYEWIGSLIKHGLIPEEPFMDVYAGRILRAWGTLEPVFAIVRRRGNLSAWENFEYLVVRARFWQKRGGAYPKGVPRIEYSDKWLAVDGPPDMNAL